MFRLKEFQEQPAALADLLPWAAMPAPDIMRLKTGEYMASLRYRGPDLESVGKAEQMAQAARINHALKHLPPGWALHAELSRGQVSGYPVRQQAVPWIVGHLDDLRAQAFGGAQPSYGSTTTWTLTFKPPSAHQQRLMHWLWEGLPKEALDEARIHEYFVEEVASWERHLRDLCPEVERLAGDDLFTYCHYAASLQTHAVSLPHIPIYLDTYLGASADLTPGIRPLLGGTPVRCLSVRLLPRQTWPGVFAKLDTLAFPFRWVQRWIPLSHEAAIRECKKYARIWTSQESSLWSMIKQECLKIPTTQVNELAVQYAAEANSLLALIGSNDVALGYYTGTAVTWDASPQVADQQLATIAHLFRAAGAVVHMEDLNSVEAWLGALPGHRYANVRRPPTHSMNLAHMLPLHTIWQGDQWNAHLDGPPLMITTTAEQSPFALNLHHGDVGDTLVLGPKGSGKSVLLATLTLQWLARYPQARAYVFEMGRSLRVATQTAGGTWYALGSEASLTLQPLAQIDQQDERLWASEWLALLYHNEGITLTPTQKKGLWEALTTLASHEPEYRTLSALWALIQDPDLRVGLESYTLNGHYGGILDADTDYFPDGVLQTFEMEELKDRPTILAPALLALLHRIDRALTGAPTMLVLDEGWLYLDIPVFHERLRQWLKTLRKKNAFVVFASQNLEDVSRSALAGTLLQECATRIYLPNPQALDPFLARIYTQCGLSARQVELIALSTPKRDYYYASPHGNRLFQLALSAEELAIAGAGSMDSLAAFQHILDTQPDNLAQTWLDTQHTQAREEAAA